MADLPTEAIYEGLVDHEAFAALPGLMARAASARSGLVHWLHRDLAHETFAYSYFTAEHIRRYDTFFEHDVWSRAASQAPFLNSLVNCDALVPASTYDRSVFFNEYVRPSGDDMAHALGIAFDTPNGQGFLSVQRGRSQGAFAENDLRSLARYTRALKQVLQVRGELASRTQALGLARATLDLMDLPLIVTDGQARVIQCNAAAEAVLARADGLRTRRGRVETTTTDQRSQLRLAITQATQRSDVRGSIVAIDRATGPAFVVTVTPLRDGAARSRALLSFQNRAVGDAATADRLRTLFGLTRQEAQVAAELARGRIIADIAARSGTSIHTVRTQAKAALSKTGTSRQAELAALVADLVAPIRSSN